MECRTGKTVYRSERAAGDALREVRERRELAVRFGRSTWPDGTPHESRTYPCPHCYGWHLTSAPLQP